MVYHKWTGHFGHFWILVDPGPGPWALKLARALGPGPVPAPIVGPRMRAQGLDPPKPKESLVLVASLVVVTAHRQCLSLHDGA